MKTNLPRHRRGFTLVELLTVIAIIGILAALLLPVLSIVKTKALVARAKLEERDIVNAITSYDTDYGRYPITPDEQNAAQGTNDFTCGFIASPQNNAQVSWPAGANGYRSFDNNSNVVSILMDMSTFPNGLPTPWNNLHQKNPKKIHYLNAKLSGYDPAKGDLNPSGGVDITGVYRDPWGNPYVITMNTSYSMDGANSAPQGTSDIFYSQQKVSQNSGNSGFFGLANNVDAGGLGDHFLFQGKVMVWSAGPDGKVDSNQNPAGTPYGSAKTGYNKDNVLSWQ